MCLAGALGFEPRNGGTKNRCLTTWRRPKDPCGACVCNRRSATWQCALGDARSAIRTWRCPLGDAYPARRQLAGDGGDCEWRRRSSRRPLYRHCERYLRPRAKRGEKQSRLGRKPDGFAAPGGNAAQAPAFRSAGGSAAPARRSTRGDGSMPRMMRHVR